MQINKSERKVILNQPSILIIHPLTWNASKKYGHKSRWCTSVDNEDYFKSYTKKGILLYCLLYETDENGKRNGDAKTKLALYQTYRKNRKWECFDMRDSKVDTKLIFSLLDLNYDIGKVINQYYNHVAPKRVFKPIIAPCKVGDMIQGIGGRMLRLTIGQELSIRWVYESDTGKHQKKSNFGGQYAMFDIKQSDIRKAEVLRVSQRQIQIKVLELETSNTMAQLLFANFDFICKLYLNRKSPNFKVMPPSCELLHDILNTPSSQFNANQS